MPFLIGPRANEEIIDTEKLVFAHISKDVIAYLRKRFPRQFVKSCSSPNESLVPATLSVLERIMRDQNIEKVYRAWSLNSPDPGQTLNISVIFYVTNQAMSVFSTSLLVSSGPSKETGKNLAINWPLFSSYST
ncbi:unnamed protein product [Cyberlindnera jadinii]|uniref:Uncharacterized protein n=1 Tax=Cyberlindnera jadinii (strain ATCC 18201 / CBS 1600 / BCRC 20928 / JCM 3617 / NBRC 0987 / NRRL Y-1542) TaxID=983966 RepID=A0A0H5CD15_CYBJN|nr:unnamed protein product [Cyberlindnera jadinii]